ncbi:hypothetical protein [Curtobacterium sp. RRHDQ10]|uniref:hypothetical protein n=1 Tax=Curtobacterium phyllosphaerae TaxID=3413379 RepID=UPI003BF09D4E
MSPSDRSTREYSEQIESILPAGYHHRTPRKWQFDDGTGSTIIVDIWLQKSRYGDDRYLNINLTFPFLEHELPSRPGLPYITTRADQIVPGFSVSMLEDPKSHSFESSHTAVLDLRRFFTQVTSTEWVKAQGKKYWQDNAIVEIRVAEWLDVI